MTAPSQWALGPVLRLTAAAMILVLLGTMTGGWLSILLLIAGAAVAVAATVRLVGHMKRKQ